MSSNVEVEDGYQWPHSGALRSLSICRCVVMQAAVCAVHI
jgi:hypothetical protein